jgi:hypothetical protein
MSISLITIILSSTLIVMAIVLGIVGLCQKKYVPAIVMLLVVISQAITIDNALYCLKIRSTYHALR